MGAGAISKPPNLEGWLATSTAALETMRLLLERPTGSHVSELENKAGDPSQVVRTLNQLQNAGLVTIQVERETHELVARVPDQSRERLRGIVRRLS